jgi:hypothetical protein
MKGKAEGFLGGEDGVEGGKWASKVVGPFISVLSALSWFAILA